MVERARPKSFRYEQITEELAREIRAGSVRAGQRLPSLRRLAQRQGVSLNTATRVYEQLEASGLIESSPKRGFYVRETRMSSAPAIQQHKAVLVSEDRTNVLLTIQRNALRPDVINLGSGVVADEFLPVAELNRSLRRASRRHGGALGIYGDPAGEASLRGAIGQVMQQRLNYLPSPEQIVVTNGCMEAVGLCVQALTRPGDVVAIFTPCYNGLLMMLQKLGRRVLEIPCSSGGPDLDYLENLLRQRAFGCLVFSAIAFNPLGFSLAPHNKARLAQLAADYATPFIEDDTFGELAYTGVDNTPVYAFDQDNYIYYCSSFSKNLCPGFRLGWVATRSNIEPFIRQKMALNLSCSSATQHALSDYLFSENYNAHLQRLRWQLQRETSRMQDSLMQRLPSGCVAAAPSGGFFLWVELPAGIPAMDIYRRAAEEKILIAPGDIFSLAALHTDKLRISCGQPWTEEIEKAIARLGELVKGMAASSSAAAN